MARQPVSVTVEVGRKRAFASALDWPGWCRSGRGAEDAVQVLAAYAARYAPVARRAGHPLPEEAATDLEVVETLEGDATTDFGAPSATGDRDRAPVDGEARRRLVALLVAGWDELDAVVASAPAELRKGPRGGGRDRDALFEHVVNAERAYARHLGVALSASEWREGYAALLRGRIREALLGEGGAAPEERRWPPRYVVRRMAWHVLDHAWEIEDRASARPPD